MIYIVDCGSKKIKDIKKCIDQLSEAYIIVKLEDIDFRSFNNIKGFIISGSNIQLTKCNEEQITAYRNLIKKIIDVEKPILGISFGHQILGLTYSASIETCKEDKKFQRIQCKVKDPLFDELPYPSVSFREDHKECISMPNEFILLASSSTCKVEAMKHLSKPIYGIQFHPEISGEYGIQLFKNFSNIINNSI